jgi:hypothetical protein
MYRSPFAAIGSLCAIILLVAQPLFAEDVSLDGFLRPDSLYTLVDLGESDVSPDLLVRDPMRSKITPVINNSGQIIGNRREGGFLRNPREGEWAPQIQNVKVYFHDLNEKGDLLVSLSDQSRPPEWAVWPSSQENRDQRQRIDGDTQRAISTLHFKALTNDRLAVGGAIVEGDSQLICWQPDKPLSAVEGDRGEPLLGQVYSVNHHSQMVGLFKCGEYVAPAVWSQEGGVQFLRNYRPRISTTAQVTIEDLAIADDGTVYGTYKVSDSDISKPAIAHYNYAWLPYEGGAVKFLDLEGMRIYGLNDWHVLVGQLEGVAAVCEPGQHPQQICKLIEPAELEGWELLAATSINNWGDIVGYGNFKGHLHLFVAQKVNSRAPYR